MAPMPSNHAVNSSVDMVAQPMPSNVGPSKPRLMTPNGGAAALDVGATDDVLKQRKNQVKNQWQRELLGKLSQK